MSVLIKMDMPKEKAVAVVILPDGTAYTAEMSAGVCTEYLADCTAIEVPAHGRLIDADALLNRDADYEYPLFDTDGSWDCVVPCYDRETIKSTPTVIEAEE